MRTVVDVRTLDVRARKQMQLTRMTIEKDIHGFPISMHGFLWFVQFLYVYGVAETPLKFFIR